jgi:hypothetical protein
LNRYEKLRAKRWNAQLRLVIEFFNVTAIGAFGLAVIAPILALLQARTQRIGEAESGDAWFTTMSYEWHEVVIWPAVAVALFFHLFAHILIQLTEPEE